MTDGNPLACSLSPGDLQHRLDEIAKLGSESLTSHETESDRHLLRFRNDAETRRRLQALVAAEARCCPFLDLTPAESDDELVLTIVAPD
jgi:hypothetical protein